MTWVEHGRPDLKLVRDGPADGAADGTGKPVPPDADRAGGAPHASEQPEPAPPAARDGLLDDDPAGAGAPDDAHSDGVFRSVHECATELLRLEARARAAHAARAPDGYAGLSALLEALLPRDDAVEARVARGVGMTVGRLRAVRAGLVDPLVDPPESMVRLGIALGLTFDQFARLISQDRARLRLGARGRFRLRERAPDVHAVHRLQALGATWEAWSVFQDPAPTRDGRPD